MVYDREELIRVLSELVRRRKQRAIERARERERERALDESKIEGKES